MPTCLASLVLDVDPTSTCQHNESRANPASYQPPEAHGLWEVRPSPGKGRGVFAVVDIPKGTRLLVEAPLFAVAPPDLVPGVGFSLADMQPAVEAAYATLSTEQQEEFMSCHEVRFPGEKKEKVDDKGAHGLQLMRILRSNAYTTQDGRIGIYPKVALINHDCRPNVFNVDTGSRRVIVATRDITAGEEVLTTYVPLLADTAARRARLAQYGFRCGCAACQAGEGDGEGGGHDARIANKDGDAERVRMGQVLNELEEAVKRLQEGAHKSKAELRRLAKAAETLAAYVEAQGFADYYVRTSRLAVEYMFRAGQAAAAVRWARKHLAHNQLADEAAQDARDAEALLAFVQNATKG